MFKIDKITNVFLWVHVQTNYGTSILYSAIQTKGTDLIHMNYMVEFYKHLLSKRCQPQKLHTIEFYFYSILKNCWVGELKGWQEWGVVKGEYMKGNRRKLGGEKTVLYDNFDVKYMTECICQNA